MTRDKGAHFYKCDFQVHTPRDLRWSGGDAISDIERKAYGEELILACRRKGVGAIAITDHHDFAFFPHVKRAARDESAYTELRTKWDELHAQKIQILGEQCQQFSALSTGLIKADIKGSLDIESLKRQLKAAFAGLNIKETKIDDLCLCVLNEANPMAAWNGILADLEKLALHKTAATDALPTTAVIDKCGFIQTEKARLASGLDSGKWLNLSVTELEFNPVFEYCTNKNTNEYIDFTDASAGQQATALLTVLLNQHGAPLIVDQPEDDIDSKMIPEIVEQIWKAKSRRQLIFASHSANFVVNGDAELVICCDYVRVGDQTGGKIKAEGAIDNFAIKDEITAVTEGGKQAFKLRMEKYGF